MWVHNDRQFRWELRGERGRVWVWIHDEALWPPSNVLAEAVLNRVGSLPPPLASFLAGAA